MSTRRAGAVPAPTPGVGARTPGPERNEISLCGRLSAPAEERTLPSGDVIVTLRVVIPRLGTTRRPGLKRQGEARPGQVDTIDVVCWSARSRRAALRIAAGSTVEVEGALRRRFFGTPAGRQSRYEVEAASVRRLADDGPTAT
ncbi:single-stranded DNA-binding protein [Intrasporangium sp.]|uniref:single-stranded DNA-binding protein n=1 Tax=Intrasporangium sp. TaxID=1925024 RepID=UPI0029398C41|nr:single-stranded DNA-binding protein [Intrasporangium sp.]MDV3220132.1 single-stranded DNA-binding protein [Intrasporangium sp.]